MKFAIGNVLFLAETVRCLGMTLNTVNRYAAQTETEVCQLRFLNLTRALKYLLIGQFLSFLTPTQLIRGTSQLRFASTISSFSLSISSARIMRLSNILFKISIGFSIYSIASGLKVTTIPDAIDVSNRTVPISDLGLRTPRDPWKPPEMEFFNFRDPHVSWSKASEVFRHEFLLYFVW